MDYDKHYRAYLGVQKDSKEIVECSQRDIPICSFYYHHIIGTEVDGREIISSSPEFVRYFRSDKRKKDEKIEEYMIRVIGEKKPELEFKRMCRMGIEKDDFTYVDDSIEITTLKDSHIELFRNTYKNAPEEKLQKAWERGQELRNQGRVFVVIKDGKIAAQARVSDISFNGGNIAVWTKEDYQGKGYAKAAVSRAVRWCFNNNVLPIYLVHDENKASIKVAEKVGFRTFSTEYIFSRKSSHK